MRTTLTLLFSVAFAVVFAVVLAPMASAQTSAECDRLDDLVYMIIDVDASGFTILMEKEFNLTLGDWVRLDITSEDDQYAHTITLTGYDESVTVSPGGFTSDQGCFELNQAGTFTLRDSPSGDEIPVHVLAEDSLGGADGTGAANGDGSSDSSGIPGVSPVLLAVAVAGLVALRRRAWN